MSKNARSNENGTFDEITALAKFRQNRHFWQIRRFRPTRQHFEPLLAKSYQNNDKSFSAEHF